MDRGIVLSEEVLEVKTLEEATTEARVELAGGDRANEEALALLKVST